jgi:hypothetical protein
MSSIVYINNAARLQPHKKGRHMAFPFDSITTADKPLGLSCCHSGFKLLQDRPQHRVLTLIAGFVDDQA